MYFNDNYIVNIDKLINKNIIFYAHRKDNKNETIKEHSDLVLKYFIKIFEHKNLENVFMNFENVYLADMSNEGIALFRKMLVNTFVFHDIGKINPNFQEKKMKNKIRIKSKFATDKSEHSELSSILYFDYFIDEVKSLSRNEMKKLRIILLVNSFIISRHHSKLIDFEYYLRKYGNDEEIVDVLKLFESNELYIPNIKSNYDKLKKIYSRVSKNIKESSKDEGIYRYTYMKLVYSLLLASDFYATSEFVSDSIIGNYGDINNMEKIYSSYKDTEIHKQIRDYEKKYYLKSNKEYKDINSLRNELFLEAEKSLLENNKNNNIFFLEAPTGSGKSNIGFNLSFKLMEESNIRKIYYIYPFNTLVEQNKNNLINIFKNDSMILNDISVINSITPIKINSKKSDEKYDIEDKNSNEDIDYVKSLLDRQFLNYPIILSTHVSLFNIMFNIERGDSFAFYQLVNSVIILDEIQSYKNIIWAEIISFLQVFAKILNIKIIIMSATLPDLSKFVGKSKIVKLIKNRKKYFDNPIFRNRVKADFNLLDSDNIENDLIESIKQNNNKKILIEFIRKQSAYDFYNRLIEDDEIDFLVEMITGDDNQVDRNNILKRIDSEEVKKKGIILVATQVIEAGIDIDMDVGFKDISKLDSEEQFMGRINRNCLKEGKVYFFDYDKANCIYKEDVRIRQELTLHRDEIRKILINKNFDIYYDKVIDIIKNEYNDSLNEDNLNRFFNNEVSFLCNSAIQKRMKLINEDRNKVSIFINRIIKNEDGEGIIGSKIWDEYCELLDDNKMEYSEKKVRLSQINSKVILFTYEIMSNNSFIYSDRRGSLFYIEDGKQYFENGKFNKNNLLKGDDFI